MTKEPKIVRLADLTEPQRRLVLALIDAAKAAEGAPAEKPEDPKRRAK